MAAIRNPSKRQAVKNHVLRCIREQNLAPGDQILSQNQLATLLGTTAVTVHKALSELAEDGIVYREKGSGTFVGRQPVSRQETRTVCLVLPGHHLDEPAYNPIYWPYVQHLYRAFLQSVGHQWSFTTHVVEPGVDPAAIAHRFATVDGVFFHHTKEPWTLLAYLVENKIAPVVAFGLPRPGLACLTIDHDMVDGTRDAVLHLARTGARRLAMVRSRFAWADGWQRGFEQGLAAAGLPFDPRLVIRVGESKADGMDGARQLIAAGLPCDAIVVDNDMRALGLIEELARAGIQVPGDVAVIGYDGLANATGQHPYLTSVEIPYRRMIERSLTILGELTSRATPHQHLSFVGDILPGKTTREAN